MSYGAMTGPAIGIIMKEMVRRAIIEIRNQRLIFQAEHKDNLHKAEEDFVTTADKEAQKIYVRVITECFPGFGITAEENFAVLCTLIGDVIYWTVDPLDGTKAYIRRQSHGIGTMLSLVVNGVIIAACVGDVMTQEIFYFRPGSSKVHRLSEFEIAETLVIDPTRTLKSQYMLLRDAPTDHTKCAQRIISEVFKSIEVSGGSIGIGFARLWKGEVGGIILLPSAETPWDFTPIVGICQKLGFRFFDIWDPENGYLEEVVPSITTEIQTRQFETLVIHESRIEELFTHTSFRQYTRG